MKPSDKLCEIRKVLDQFPYVYSIEHVEAVTDLENTNIYSLIEKDPRIRKQRLPNDFHKWAERLHLRKNKKVVYSPQYEDEIAQVLAYEIPKEISTAELSRMSLSWRSKKYRLPETLRDKILKYHKDALDYQILESITERPLTLDELTTEISKHKETIRRRLNNLNDIDKRLKVSRRAEKIEDQGVGVRKLVFQYHTEV